MSNDFIKEFWENRCKEHKGSHNASFADINAINLEVNTIAKYIKDEDIVLDVGCANGYSTIKQAAHHHLAEFYGVDFCESMIDVANDRGCEDIVFKVGDERIQKE